MLLTLGQLTTKSDGQVTLLLHSWAMLKKKKLDSSCTKQNAGHFSDHHHTTLQPGSVDYKTNKSFDHSLLPLQWQCKMCFKNIVCTGAKWHFWLTAQSIEWRTRFHKKTKKCIFLNIEKQLKIRQIHPVLHNEWHFIFTADHWSFPCPTRS